MLMFDGFPTSQPWKPLFNGFPMPIPDAGALPGFIFRFARQSNPATLPSSYRNCISMSDNGLYLAMAYGYTTSVLDFYKKNAVGIFVKYSPTGLAALPTWIYDIEWSRDGNYLAICAGSTGGGKWSLYKRNADDNFTAISLSGAASSNGQKCSFNHAGTRVAFCGETASYYLAVYTISGTTATKLTITQPGQAVYGCCFSPDGTYLATCGAAGTVCVYKWNGTTYIQLLTSLTSFYTSGYIATTVEYSADGRHLVFLGNSNITAPKLYKQTGDVIDYLGQLSVGGISSSTVCFSPDNKYLLWRGAGTYLKIFERTVDAYSEIATAITDIAANGVNFSPANVGDIYALVMSMTGDTLMHYQ